MTPSLSGTKTKPCFIVFEGIDGSGKSTQAKLLAARLADSAIPVLLTAEPSDGPVGLIIRSLTTRPSPEKRRGSSPRTVAIMWNESYCRRWQKGAQ